MKLIAHRGASLERPENTLESLEFGSELGAYAVECDVRMTFDRKYVIYHDDNLSRLGGDERKVADVTCDEMNKLLAANGRHLMTLDELFAYKGQAYVLLHIKLRGTDAVFFRKLADSPVKFICGVERPEAALVASEFFRPGRILAFIPDPPDREWAIRTAKRFHDSGAGIIRLWENWLGFVTPEDIKTAIPGCEVWIMANRRITGMNGTRESLEYIEALGADGVLLNDIRLGVEYISEKSR